MAKLVLGIDPDLHNTGFAFVMPQGVVYAGCVTVATAKKGAKAIVEMARNLAAAFELLGELAPDLTIVEGQRLYGDHKRPQDIVHLANAAGAALGVVHMRYPSTVAMLPYPQDWKGTVPKGVKQRRILEATGMRGIDVIADRDAALPLRIPDWGENIRKTQWSHVIDAIGLAQWGLTAYRAKRAQKAADGARGS